MVVLLDDAPLSAQQLRSPNAALSALTGSRSLIESARRLLAAPAPPPSSAGLLYLHQRECAFVRPSDPTVRLVASDDATTCHLAVVRRSATGDAAFCHFDGTGANRLVRLFEARFYSNGVATDAEADAAAPLELHLAGGFQDVRGESDRLTLELLAAFARSGRRYRLVTACVAPFNTVQRDGRPHPRVTGLALSLADGGLAPVSVPLRHRGPWQALRSLHFLGSGDDVFEVYDPDRHCLVLQPFDYSGSGLPARYADATDAQLARLSTSPEQEPAHFVACLRRALRFARDNRRPGRQVFHRGALVERPLPDGTWQHVSGASEEDMLST